MWLRSLDNGVEDLSYWLSKKLNVGRTHMQTKARHFLCLFSGFGLLAVFWGGLPSQYRDSRHGSWDFCWLGVGYHLFLLFSISILGFQMWLLSRRLEEANGILRLLQKISSDSGCGSCFGGIFCSSTCLTERVFCKVRVREKGKKVPVTNKVDLDYQQSCHFISRNQLEEETKEDDEIEGIGEAEFYSVEEDDVTKLNIAVRMERRRREVAELEIERERQAAKSAAEELMLTIQRLQIEKGRLEMEARHYREIDEQKRLYDQEVIDDLCWIISKHESERRGLGVH